MWQAELPLKHQTTSVNKNRSERLVAQWWVDEEAPPGQLESREAVSTEGEGAGGRGGRDEERGGRQGNRFAILLRSLFYLLYHPQPQSGLLSPQLLSHAPCNPDWMPLLTPTISRIGCSVLEVGGGGLYRPLSAQVLTDAANGLEQKRFTPTRHPLPAELRGNISYCRVFFFFSLCRCFSEMLAFKT